MTDFDWLVQRSWNFGAEYALSVTAQSINESSKIPPSNELDVNILTLSAELDGVRQLTEGGGFNTVVGDFKSLTDVTVWLQANLPSDAPKFEYFIDLNILLARI